MDQRVRGSKVAGFLCADYCQISKSRRTFNPGEEYWHPAHHSPLANLQRTNLSDNTQDNVACQASLHSVR